MTPSSKAAKNTLRGPLRIVTIGGGTGLSTLLQGLKAYSPERRESPGPQAEITAIVTVTDDGGSSGRLRREFDILPPGDIRNCMVALAEDEALMSKLFQYRFASGAGLKGHSFGNLFLTALTSLTGDFAHAVGVSCGILAIVGKIYPSTQDNVVLEAKLADGKVVAGETKISKSRSRIERIALRPSKATPLQEALKAIAEADLITLGPGSLFTSVVPNLLVDGIPEAIRKSRAVKAYLSNLMWQPGETSGFTLADHVEAIHNHSYAGLLDYVVVNTKPIAGELLTRYASKRSQPVKDDRERLKPMGVRVVGADLLGESEMIRHDPERTAQLAMKLARMGRRQRQLFAAARKAAH